MGTRYRFSIKKIIGHNLVPCIRKKTWQQQQQISKQNNSGDGRDRPGEKADRYDIMHSDCAYLWAYSLAQTGYKDWDTVEFGVNGS